MANNSENRRDLKAQLLRAIQANCDRPNKDLAFDLDVDASTLSRLRDRLEKEKLIKAYKAILDPERFGLVTLAYIKLALTKTDKDSVAETVRYLAELPEVQEIHSIQGQFDMMVKIRVKSNNDVLEFTLQKTTQDHNIKDTETMIIMRTHKESTDIPV